MAFGDVFRVRRAEQADYVAVTEVLLRSRHASVPAIPPLVHLDVEAKKHFVGTVMPFCGMISLVLRESRVGTI